MSTDTDGNRMIWDERLRQWVPVTGALSPAELANEMQPVLSSRFVSLDEAATLGQVPTSDGAGGVTWEDITLAGTLPVANGGTGATSAAAARSNLGVVSSVVKRKATTESLTTTTTLQDDNELLFAIAADEVAAFEVVIFPEASDATADMKINFTVPSGATVRFATFATRGSDELMQATSSHTAAVVQVNAGGAGSYSYPIKIMGSVLNGSTAGNVTLQWAQSVSAGTTSVLAGSYLIAHKTT